MSDIQGTTTEKSWIPLPSSVDGWYAEVQVEEKTFMISKELLCRHSSYFKTAMGSGFKESQTSVFVLDERLDVFKIFYAWLHRDNLDFLALEDTIKDHEELQKAYVDIYAFSDRRGIPVLGDQVLQKFDDLIRPDGLPIRVIVEVIVHAWETLPSASGLCQYLVAIERDANRCYLPPRSEADYEWLPGGFTAALLKLTEDDCDMLLTATVLKKPVNMAKLDSLVKNAGGYDNLNERGRWVDICQQMGFQVGSGADALKLRGHMRALYRRWMCPWNRKLIQLNRSELEKECPRPFVKEYFGAALASLKNKGRSISIPKREPTARSMWW